MNPDASRQKGNATCLLVKDIDIEKPSEDWISIVVAKLQLATTLVMVLSFAPYT
jgi:hypothetical protein